MNTKALGGFFSLSVVWRRCDKMIFTSLAICSPIDDIIIIIIIIRATKECGTDSS